MFLTEKNFSSVRKRDGRVVPFDKKKISDATYKAIRATGGKDKKLAEQLAAKVYELLSSELKDEVPTVEQVQDYVERVLIEEGQSKVAKAYILYRQKRAEARAEKAKVLDKESIDEIDKRFDLNALRVLKSRYLKKDETGRVIESPKELFARIAVHIGLADVLYDNKVFNINGSEKTHKQDDFDPIKNAEKLNIGKYKLNQYHLEALKRVYDRFNRNGQMKVGWNDFLDLIRNKKLDHYEKNIDQYFDVMVNKKFMPNTPAIANFGNRLGLGSACFVVDIDDSLDSIMGTLANAAKIFQAGGGLGYNFSRLRPEGDFVSSSSGQASGPLSFMRLYDTMTEVIKQGGCVSTDTLVRTDKGLLPMINMLNSPPLKDNPTDYFVFDGKEFNFTWLAQNNGFASVYDIKTELGNGLYATANHLMAVATENGIEWKSVDKLIEGDWLITVLGGHQGRKIRLPGLKDQHHNSNKLKIPEYLDVELAELLGLYIADGCFNRGRMLISVNSKDADLIKRIEYLMEKLFGLKVGERRDKKTYIDLVFFSKDLEKYFELQKWKKHRSWDSFIPAEILQSEKPVAYAFLRGMFEGNGSIHTDGYPLLYSSSETLVDETQQLLLSLGIVSKKHTMGAEKLRGHFGKRNMHKLILLTNKSVEIFKNNIGFITEKKKKLLEKYFRTKEIEYSDLIPTFSSIFERYYQRVGRGSGKNRGKKGADLKYYKDVYHYLKGDRTLTRRNLRELLETHTFLKDDRLLKLFSDEKYFFNRITSVRNGAEKYTMEIEVPGSDSYIANGFLVHNIRRGANMGILNSNHPDIEKFITAKKGNQALKNFNISVLIMPDFWEYYKKNEPYPLVNPKNGQVVRKVNPRMLFDLIVYQAWESAEPGVIFFDHVNKYNPFFEHLGPIVTTNPCGEVLLYGNESCNLGSINVWAFAKENDDDKIEYDWDGLAETIKTSTQFLDNVVDMNKYPLKEIEEMTLATRKIGLGVMGVGDLLFELGIPFNSDEGRKFMEKLMQFINYHSKLQSIELAKERGTMPYFDKSFYLQGKLPFSGFDKKEEWDFDWNEIAEKIKKNGIRNGYTTIIAPTGSISMIAGCSSGMEPVYSLVFEKHVAVGSFYYVNPIFEKILRENGLFDEDLIEEISKMRGSIQGIKYVPAKLKKTFVIALDITPEDHIRALASFQKWTDSSISKTNNFPANATVDDMKKSYLLAYELGCKDVTVFRDTSIAQQVLVGGKQTLTDKKGKDVQPIVLMNPIIASANQSNIKTISNCPECNARVNHDEGCVTCPSCGWGLCA